MKALCVLLLTSAFLSAQPPKHTYTYKVVGDCKTQADAYRAPGDGVRPVILWIHGGALIMGNRSGINSIQL
jgi:acetyl esterase/lipase